ncbi:cytochrome c [Polynucleobacter sp. AM-26B4]|uniref:c-type cytochrome n=1 Tax=Polynucleobacter sp. AM-26B4 TaxID=2689103 RepID=UPI001C0BA32D|nr:c-type cytochrome [Polynucleobacter sp. AM-26B4]MBU3585920.1 cytochrome c4 [Polynucleobacter sp. AM-26B4]
MQYLRIATLALGLVCSSAASLSFAQDIKSKIQVCGACHGADGNSKIAGTPSLAGQPKTFLENQMVMIREGMRNIPAMTGQLDGISDAEIVAIAKFYSSSPAVSQAGDMNTALFNKGQIISKEALCGTCHLPNYVGRDQMPRIAAQREDYLFYSMKQFRSNQATGRDTIMAASLYGMSDDDLKAIAHYLSQLK